jgi:hypothetical protein
VCLYIGLGRLRVAGVEVRDQATERSWIKDGVTRWQGNKTDVDS